MRIVAADRCWFLGIALAVSLFCSPLLFAAGGAEADDVDSVVSSSTYLQMLVVELESSLEPLGMASPRNVELIILPVGFKNAYALPPDKIVFTQGLLDSLSSEQEIKFVLAHELGHLALHQHSHLQSLAPASNQTGAAIIEIEADAFALSALANSNSIVTASKEVLHKLAGEKPSSIMEERLSRLP